ncbi:hypothetical protein CHUAL_007299 [Chamberlinius hualienensis]
MKLTKLQRYEDRPNYDQLFRLKLIKAVLKCNYHSSFCTFTLVSVNNKAVLAGNATLLRSYTEVHLKAMLFGFGIVIEDFRERRKVAD